MNLRRLKIWQWAVLLLLGLTALSWWLHRPDARTRQLNAAIESQASAQLKAYPYEFRVLRLEGRTAVMSTPRNVAMPAFRALGAMFPQLDVKNANDPAFIAAQQQLGAVQDEARKIVAAQPGVAGVRWELDQHWLRAHSIELSSN